MTHTLLHALLDTSTADDDRAVTIDGTTLSRNELRERSAGFAADLRRLGPGQVVAVNAEPTLTTVIAVVGALLAGVPVVPVPPDAGHAEVAHIVADSPPPYGSDRAATGWTSRSPTPRTPPAPPPCRNPLRRSRSR